MNLQTPSGAQGVCALVAVEGNGDTCSQSELVIENNVFENIDAGPLRAKAFMGGGGILQHNRFTDIMPANLPSVQIYVPGGRLRDNLFSNTSVAVAADYSFYPPFTVDAEFNWWGDSTGPYHPVENPHGLGDEVGDGVDFAPWRTDTTFWYDYDSAPRRPPRLPLAVSLVAYPNPFNSVTTFRLETTQATIVRLELFDLLGQRITEIWSGAVPYRKEISFPADDLPSGLYLARAFDPLHNRPLALTKIVLLK
jgi:hypothetical protein